MKIAALAVTTFREAIRKKVLLVLLVFAFIFIGSSLLLGYFSGGEQIRMIKDVGLTGMLVFGLLIATFLGMTLIPNDIERHIIYTVLSKPVRRLEVIFGKFFGAALALLSTMLLMGIVFLALIFFKEMPHAISGVAVLAILLTFLELLVVLAMAITFSTFSSATLSLVLTIFFYILGSSSDSLQYLGGRSDSPLVKALSRGLGYLIPNFEIFNVRSQVLHGDSVPWMYVLKAVTYGLLLTLALLIVAGMFFREKEV